MENRAIYISKTVELENTDRQIHYGQTGSVKNVVATDESDTGHFIFIPDGTDDKLVCPSIDLYFPQS